MSQTEVKNRTDLTLAAMNETEIVIGSIIILLNLFLNHSFFLYNKVYKISKCNEKVT